jgi:hypothetical protein
MCMYQANVVKNVGATNIIYHTKFIMRKVYEQMRVACATIWHQISRNNSFHHVEISQFAPTCGFNSCGC